jgi:anti-sigma28 factor (negative regulator of flagellin synthesis)
MPGCEKVQLSDREIQNTLDLLKRSEKMGGTAPSVQFSAEEIEGIQQVVKQIDSMPEIRKDRVDKVKRALESSSYNVTGDEVAKKLIGRIFSDKLD